MTYIKDVFMFHQRFGVEQPDTARQMSEDLAEFRLNFLKEELAEYEHALIAGDLEGQLDSLVDLAWITIGAALQSGFDFDTAWNRVAAANMLKEAALPDGSNSRRFSRFDVVKPHGWKPPQHGDLVDLTRPLLHRRRVPDQFIDVQRAKGDAVPFSQAPPKSARES